MTFKWSDNFKLNKENLKTVSDPYIILTLENYYL